MVTRSVEINGEGEWCTFFVKHQGGSLAIELFTESYDKELVTKS